MLSPTHQLSIDAQKCWEVISKLEYKVNDKKLIEKDTKF